MLINIILVFILTGIFIWPAVVFSRWVVNYYDRVGKKTQITKISYFLSESPLTGFAGHYDLNFSLKVYFAEFSINNQKFREVISERIRKSSEIVVSYLIGKSGKIYIKKLNHPIPG